MSVIVTLAAFNEGKNISSVINKINAHGYLCIVVDDGSTDDTSIVAKSCGALVVRHSRNLGQGDAVLSGFKAALLFDECEIIVEMDADGQHDPDEIPLFIEEMRKANVDIVVGSRILGSSQKNASFLRQHFLPYYTSLINYLTGYKMTDALCGFRAFRRNSIDNIEPILDRMLEPQYLAAEMFVRFSRVGMTISEVPIQMQQRLSGTSHKGVFRYGFGILKAIVRTLFDLGRKAQ